MHIQVKDQVTVDAPASKAWRILAQEFDRIDKWSSGIAESRGITNVSIPEGATVGGRFCLSPGSGGDATEAFTYYDKQAMRFGYKAIGELPWPWLLKEAENNWQVSPISSEKSIVEFRAEVEVATLPGLILIPLLPLMKKFLGTRTLEELKFYVEHDQPHPRKLKALQKYEATSTHA